MELQTFLWIQTKYSWINKIVKQNGEVKNMLINPNYLTQKPVGDIYLLYVSCVSNKVDNTEI